MIKDAENLSQSLSINTKNIVAAFDFDGTITTRDCLLPFIRKVVGDKQFFSKIPALIPIYLAYRLGIKTNHYAKQFLLKSYLNGFSYESLLQQGKIYADKQIPALVKPEALERLRWHQAQKHRCVLISAGLELYLSPWAQQYGFDDLICTQIKENANGTTDGEIIGINCFGPEKVRRLLAKLGPKNQFTLYAYGDSRGDRELLALADYAYYRAMPAPG